MAGTPYASLAADTWHSLYNGRIPRSFMQRISGTLKAVTASAALGVTGTVRAVVVLPLDATRMWVGLDDSADNSGTDNFSAWCSEPTIFLVDDGKGKAYSTDIYVEIAQEGGSGAVLLWVE